MKETGFLLLENITLKSAIKDSKKKRVSQKYNRPPKGQFMSAFGGRLKLFLQIFNLPSVPSLYQFSEKKDC